MPQTNALPTRLSYAGSINNLLSLQRDVVFLGKRIRGACLSVGHVSEATHNFVTFLAFVGVMWKFDVYGNVMERVVNFH